MAKSGFETPDSTMTKLAGVTSPLKPKDTFAGAAAAVPTVDEPYSAYPKLTLAASAWLLVCFWLVGTYIVLRAQSIATSPCAGVDVTMTALAVSGTPVVLGTMTTPAVESLM